MIITGYEQPVEMPSMGVYDTDLMKMYMSEVKNQYEKGQEEMKDFMKLYQDFYSDVPGATDLYNQMTIGGARDLINNMYAQGIDPFKSPEARAAIRKYIYGVHTGKLNEMKRSAESAKEFKKNRDKLIAAGLYDKDQERYENAIAAGLDPNDPKNLKTLEEWDSSLAPWTQTMISPRFDLTTALPEYFKNFRAQEYLGPSRPGYALYGTKDERQNAAIDSALSGLANNTGFKFFQHKANKAAEGLVHEDGTPVTGQELVRQQFKDFATQYFQPKEEDDKVAQNKIAAADSNWLDQQKQARTFNYWKERQKYNPKSPLYEFGDVNITSGKTGKSYADWWSMFVDDAYVKTKGEKSTFLEGQMKKVGEAFKNANGQTEITDNSINRALRAMSHDVPSYTVATLLNRTANKDGSFDISIGDVSRIYAKDHIVDRIVGAPVEMRNKRKQYEQKTWDARSTIKNNLKDKDTKSMQMSPQNKFLYYMNPQGIIRVFVPIHVVRNTENDGKSSDEYLFDTKITGTIDKDGNFVTTNEQYLETFNKDMTHKFANKSDYSAPIGFGYIDSDEDYEDEY